jgi:3-methyladenine DNA glycosylase AlkC
MEKFKEALNPARVKRIAEVLSRAYPAFPEKRFLNLTLPDLEKHELKGRVRLIAAKLKECLPPEPQKVFPLLLKSIRSPTNPAGLEGFQAWPLTQLVEDIGLGDPELALDTLKGITSVMSAEFAVRPFLLQHEKLSLSVFRRWAKSEDVHVRRLVSEGTRPRLPWGQRLPVFQKNPTITIGLLRELRHDPELYVRKSVANHLNDIAKDHPDWLVKELAAWQREFPESSTIRWIIRHASRHLVKAGHAKALELQGYQPAKIEKAKVKVRPNKAAMGKRIEIQFSATARREEPWLIDYCIHHRKKNGALSPKVFKWARKAVKKGELKLSRNHHFREITTRRYYPGRHILEILVNGKPVAQTHFHLETK